MMDSVFADSQFWIALLNPRDQWHDRAVHVLESLNRAITTTRFVMLEVADAFAKPPHREWYRELIDQIASNSDVRLLEAAESQFVEGERLYFERQDKAWSLTDCISFSTMMNEGLMDALTADHHFEQAGFLAMLR